MKYGDRLRHAREARGWSQKELEHASNVTQKTISKIECGDTEISRHNIALARALGVRIEWLAYGDGPMHETDAAGNPVPLRPSVVAEARLRYEGRDAELLHILADMSGITIEEILQRLVDAGLAQVTTQSWLSRHEQAVTNGTPPHIATDRRTEDRPVGVEKRSGERRRGSRKGPGVDKVWITTVPKKVSPGVPAREQI